MSELEEIKVPLELLEFMSISFCRDHRILPLRLDEEAKSLSLAFVDSEVGQLLESFQKKHQLKHLSLYQLSESDFEEAIQMLQTQFGAEASLQSGIESLSVVEENSAAKANWTIALIEKDPKIREAMQALLASQGYTVISFLNEADFKFELEKLSNRLHEDDDILNLAENKELVPFRAVIVRQSSLEKPKTFSDFVWAHFNHLRVSILPNRWLQPVLEEAQFQTASDREDFSFHLRHANYYHAAIECLKKGNVFQAVELLEQVTEKDAHYVKAKILLGKAFLRKKNYNKAEAQFRKAYEHWSEDAEEIVDENILKLLYYLAYTQEKMGRLDEALKLYERVASENPLFQEVGQRLAKVKNMRRKAIKAGEKKLGLASFSKKEKTQLRYEREEEIGKGGMGIVYRAKDRVLGREVALKILNSHFKDDEKIVETFLREAKSLAALNHLNIVTIFDAGIEEGNYYISMEFIDGMTVRELLKKKGFFRLSTSIALSKQVLKALAYAHSKHVIHRDITTNNMMLTETKVVKLMDFGLARVVNQLHSEQSIIGGTPYFMSPEQVEGAPIDHRTDIYSFGVCLFEMLTGQVPFPMENPGYHHLHTDPPHPRSLKPDLPEEVASIILKCLEKKPENRYQYADEILSDIRRLRIEPSHRVRIRK